MIASMAWEVRGHCEYFYAKIRVGAGPRSVYMGRGELAQAIASAFELAKFELGCDKLAEKDLEREIHLARKALHELEAALESAYLGAGFHYHRGSWRQIRAQSVWKSKLEPSCHESGAIDAGRARSTPRPAAPVCAGPSDADPTQRRTRADVFVWEAGYGRQSENVASLVRKATTKRGQVSSAS